MRKLIVTEFVSLDGVMEAPGGEEGFKHSGWVFAAGQDEGQGKFKFDETIEADVQLLGRVDLRGLRGGVAEAQRRVRRQVQLDEEVRRLDDARRSAGVGELGADLRRRPPPRSRS